MRASSARRAGTRPVAPVPPKRVRGVRTPADRLDTCLVYRLDVKTLLGEIAHCLRLYGFAHSFGATALMVIRRPPLPWPRFPAQTSRSLGRRFDSSRDSRRSR